MKYSLVYPDAKPPVRKHVFDAGLDLFAYMPAGLKSMALFQGNTQVIRTGIRVEIPTGCFGMITNKGSNYYLVGAGIVDAGYQGEVLVRIYNPTIETLTIHHEEAIAQLIIIPCLLPELELVDELEITAVESPRGKSGGINKFVEQG